MEAPSGPFFGVIFGISVGFPAALPCSVPVAPVGAELVSGCVIPGVCAPARAFSSRQGFGSGKVYPGNNSGPSPGRCGAAPGAQIQLLRAGTLSVPCGAIPDVPEPATWNSQLFPRCLSHSRPRSAGKGLAQLVCRWSSPGSLLSELVPYQPGSGVGMGLGWAPGWGWGWDGLCGSRPFSRGHSCTWRGGRAGMDLPRSCRAFLPGKPHGGGFPGVPGLPRGFIPAPLPR